MRLVDEHTLEADIAKEQNLNGLFEQLSRQNIEIVSMRNKVNRLEEIFMRLVETGATAGQGGAGGIGSSGGTAGAVAHG
jgi:ABC-2 type transport system ATP-binding protein